MFRLLKHMYRLRTSEKLLGQNQGVLFYCFKNIQIRYKHTQIAMVVSV